MLRLKPIGDSSCTRSKLAEAMSDWWTAELPATANVAVSLSAAQRAAMAACCDALHRALRAVVRQYPHDPRIQAIYDLPDSLRAILRTAESEPYELGFYRPDLVFDRSGHPRICEIGARYPLNGWVLSALLEGMDAADEASIPSSSADSSEAFVNAKQVQNHAGPQAQTLWLLLHRHYPPGSTLALVHNRERGAEVHGALARLRAQGVNVLDVSPQVLALRNGAITADQGGKAITIDQCLLELDRTELDLFAPDVLQALIAQGQYRNDVRTLILVHDKRVLCVLSDPDILRDLVNADDAQTLKPWLIPSYVGNDSIARERLLEAPQNLIAKRSSGGRGIDAVIRSQCAPHEWRHLIETEWSSFMFQDYLDQLAFESEVKANASSSNGQAQLGSGRCPVSEAKPLQGASSKPGGPVSTPVHSDPNHDYERAAASPDGAGVHLVGMMLCCNERFLGPGVFRGSRDAIINVHQGRGQLYPVQVRL